MDNLSARLFLIDHLTNYKALSTMQPQGRISWPDPYERHQMLTITKSGKVTLKQAGRPTKNFKAWPDKEHPTNWLVSPAPYIMAKSVMATDKLDAVDYYLKIMSEAAQRILA